MLGSVMNEEKDKKKFIQIEHGCGAVCRENFERMKGDRTFLIISAAVRIMCVYKMPIWRSFNEGKGKESR